MTQQKQTICLCMIVKNEVSVIQRCLDSVMPYITHWVIVDTGSTDGTQEVIRKHMAHLPGELYEREWKDFAHNRSEALMYAREKAEYSLIIDADDVVKPYRDGALPTLEQDAYMMMIDDAPLKYPRIQLVNNRLKWRYKGVLHEFVHCDEPNKVGMLDWEMVRNHDGARRKDPKAFEKDVEVFLKALETEQDPFLRTRYHFYLAQSYKDCRQYKEAIQYYKIRSTMGGWVEEVYYSLYQVGRLMERLEYPEDEIISIYEQATKVLPSRIEALYAASKLCRVKKRYKQGYEIAKQGLGKPYPANSLFGEPYAYEIGIWDELAVNAYWIEKHAECIKACLMALKTEKLKGDDYQRVINNMDYSLKKMAIINSISF